jgi:hypothetical protein
VVATLTLAAATAALVLNLERQRSKERTKNRETERVARVGVVRLGKIYLTDYYNQPYTTQNIIFLL